MKPSYEKWLYYRDEHLKHVPENIFKECNDHNRLIAIQDLLTQKGILRHDLIMEKEWANHGFIVPQGYCHYDDEEIMELCRFARKLS